MSASQASFPVSVMARMLGVSKAGYYAWLHRPPSVHADADATLLKRIRTMHANSRQTYGAPRVHAELRADGDLVCSHDRVRHLAHVEFDGGVTERRGATASVPRCRPRPRVHAA